MLGRPYLPLYPIAAESQQVHNRRPVEYPEHHDAAHTQSAAPQKQVAPAARAAVSGPVLPAALRACHARTLGIPLLLLVSVRLGRPCIRAAWHCLQQTQSLMSRTHAFKERQAGRAYPCCPAAIGEGRSNTPGSTPGASLLEWFLCSWVLRTQSPSCAKPYCAGGVTEAVAGAVWSWFMFDSTLISTRRFLARPAAVRSVATCWSLPIPIR